MRTHKRLTVAVLIKLLSLSVLGCGDDQELTEKTVNRIQALAGVRGTLYLAAYRDGVFRLNNRSHSWENIFTNGVARSLATNGTTLYVGSTSGIFRLEHGETFTKITPQGELLGVSLLADGESLYTWGGKLFRQKTDGDEWLKINTSWDDDTIIHSLVVKGDAFYVLTETQGVFHSVDGGNSWMTINKGLPNKPIVKGVFAPLLFSQNTLYIGTTIGVYRLPLGTTTWISSGIHGRWVKQLAGSETALYAGTWQGGVFRSNDGKNWRYIGLEGIRVGVLYLFNNRLYVGTVGGEGLFYTDDDGNTWHPLNKGLNHLIR